MANPTSSTDQECTQLFAPQSANQQAASSRLPTSGHHSQVKLTRTMKLNSNQERAQIELISLDNIADCRPHNVTATRIILVPNVMDQYLTLSSSPVLVNVKLGQSPVASRASRRTLLDRRRSWRAETSKLQTVDENNNNNNNDQLQDENMDLHLRESAAQQDSYKQEDEEEEEEEGEDISDHKLDQFRQIGASLRQISDEFVRLRLNSRN